jgi:hypothetical protein
VKFVCEGHGCVRCEVEGHGCEGSLGRRCVRFECEGRGCVRFACEGRGCVQGKDRWSSGAGQGWTVRDCSCAAQ